MPIPDFQKFMLPILRMAGQGELKTAEAIGRLSDEFALTPEERTERLASGRQTRVANRVYWAFVHLTKAGLLERKSRGVYGISEEGRRILDTNPPAINIQFLLNYPEFRQFRSLDTASSGDPSDHEKEVVKDGDVNYAEETPDERIEAAVNEFNTTLVSELRDRLKAITSTAFERLIVELMTQMGYGDDELNKHVGGPGDGAIDGIVHQDLLGLDVIYLQAKKYDPDTAAIGPDKIREFAGALDERGATRGVFVTTSHFTKSAREYVDRSHKRLKLIDGDELARLMLKHMVGVREERTIVLKRIDQDFFDELSE